MLPNTTPTYIVTFLSRTIETSRTFRHEGFAKRVAADFVNIENRYQTHVRGACYHFDTNTHQHLPFLQVNNIT